MRALCAKKILSMNNIKRKYDDWVVVIGTTNVVGSATSVYSGFVEMLWGHSLITLPKWLTAQIMRIVVDGMPHLGDYLARIGAVK